MRLLLVSCRLPNVLSQCGVDGASLVCLSFVVSVRCLSLHFVVSVWCLLACDESRFFPYFRCFLSFRFSFFVEGYCYYIDIIVEHLDLYTFRRRRFYLHKTTLFDLHIGKMLLWSR